MRGLLVGYGSIGRRHLTNLRELGVQDWALVHTGRGTLAVDLPPGSRVYSDLHEALRQETPTFAVIANPTSAHAASATACLDAGCHVLLEKPVSHSIEGLDRLADAEQTSSGEVLVGFQFRFHPALQEVRELLRRLAVGRPLHTEVVWGEFLPSWHPWEDWRNGYAAVRELGGGVHHTICHPFDYLRWWFGDAQVVRAALTIHGPLELDVAEAADVLLRFASDVTAHVRLDYWSRPQTHRVEITCSDGTIAWNFMTGQLRVWSTASDEWMTKALPSVESRNELFVDEVRHFLDIVNGHARPICGLDDGIAVAQLCTAIERDWARDPVVPTREGER
jgi:predicted dehydrogenase